MSVLANMMVALTMMLQGIDDTGTAIARPIGEVYLNEATGSYYQVFDFVGKPPHTWEHARRMVKGYRYQGREGRLAIVRDIETHYFLIMKFPKMRETRMWIGLRATCGDGAELAWVDESSLQDQSFRGFGEGVLREISRTCRARPKSGDILPIFYEPDGFGVRWQVGNARTNQTYMMVEFPVPEEEGEAAPESDAANADKQP